MDLFNENGRFILISVYSSSESRISMFLVNLSLPFILVACFLSIRILNCCIPTTIRMRILGIAQLFVALLYINIQQKYMHAGKYNTRISSFKPEPTYHIGCWRQNKKQGTWPRLNFLIENGGALSTNPSTKTP